MRTLVIIFLLMLLLVGGVVAFLVATTPSEARLVRFPLSETHRELLAQVPESAEAIAIVPSPAVLHQALLENPVTRDVVLQWTAEHELPAPWMLGEAPIAMWKVEGTTSYAAHLDPLRAWFVRVWLMVSSNAHARWERSTLIVNAPQPPAARFDIDSVASLGAALPEGDAIVIQREASRGAYPPIGRPVVTSIRVTGKDLILVSRAASDDALVVRDVRGRFPRGAVLSASFAAPPRILGDINRLLGTRIDALVDEGGSIALYDVETGTLLPRPRGVIVVPADEHSRAQFRQIESVAALVGETRDTGERLLVSFDRTSLGLYEKDAFVEAAWPANRWALRIDPVRLVPILRKVGDSRGVRFAAPRLQRAARDLRGWIGALEKAEAVEAAASVEAGVEELRVRIAAK